MAEIRRENVVVRDESSGPFYKRIYWGAIFAGAVVAMVVMLLLGLLGLGIGLGTINPATEQDPFGGVAVGAGIWYVISMLAALFAGGWVAGRTAGFARTAGLLHGVVMWGLVSLASFWLMTSALGAVIGGAASVVSRAAGLAASAMAQAAPLAAREIQQWVGEKDIPTEQIKQTVGEVLKKSFRPARKELAKGEVTPEQLQEQIVQSLNRLVTQGEQAVDRENMIKLLAENTGMSRQEAAKTVDAWIEQYRQLRAQAGQTATQVQEKTLQAAGRALDIMAAAALWSFFAMLLGGLAAAGGGWLGAPVKTTEVR